MTTTTRSRAPQRQVTVSQSNGARSAPQPQAATTAAHVKRPRATSDELIAYYDSKLSAAFDKGRATARPEVAEPQLWWDVITLGVFQDIWDPPFLPGDVIRAGEPAYILSYVILNPFFPVPPTDACTVLSNFSLPFEITYQTGDVTNWKKGPSQLNVEHDLTLVPGQCWYEDILEFTTDDLDEVMYEMNVSARIFGCGGDYSPYFAGFAREVYDIDPDMFSPAPGMGDRPIRFMVYGGAPQEV